LMLALDLYLRTRGHMGYGTGTKPRSTDELGVVSVP